MVTLLATVPNRARIWPALIAARMGIIIMCLLNNIFELTQH